MPASPTNLDRIDVAFDHDQAAPDAGLLLTATLMSRLGLEAVCDQMVSRGYRPGRKLATLVTSLVAGGDCIDDIAALRAGSTRLLLGHQVMAPSTVGTWLRTFTFGHVRQLDKVSETMLTRAWTAGGPDPDATLYIDVDSTIVEVHGYDKQGATYGYTRCRGLHPLIATRADTGEVLHTRQRKGSANTARGAARFLTETIGRVRRAGYTGQIVIRADGGFWSRKNIAVCVRHEVGFSITVRRHRVIVAAIQNIPEGDWVDIAYTAGGDAQVAETVWSGHRVVVRRTRITDDPSQPELFANWRHHAFVTDHSGDAVDADRVHRAHAKVELAIRALKNGAGMCHMPSGDFAANSAWLVANALAHNMMIWVQTIAALGPVTVRSAKTLRRRVLSIAGRLTRSGRQTRLHLPTGWPWANTFCEMLGRVRALPAIG